MFFRAGKLKKNIIVFSIPFLLIENLIENYFKKKKNSETGGCTVKALQYSGFPCEKPDVEPSSASRRHYFLLIYHHSPTHLTEHLAGSRPHRLVNRKKSFIPLTSVTCINLPLLLAQGVFFPSRFYNFWKFPPNSGAARRIVDRCCCWIKQKQVLCTSFCFPDQSNLYANPRFYFACFSPRKSNSRDTKRQLFRYSLPLNWMMFIIGENPSIRGHSGGFYRRI